MGKILHYFNCAVNLINFHLKRVLICAKDFICKLCAIGRCIYKSLFLCDAKSMDAKLHLEAVYPNVGNLSNKHGFLYSTFKYDLSIIIPLYNAEAYVNACIESILKQNTHYTYQIILVDDGSVDNTMKCIEPFLLDPRILLLRQENKGQSAARNEAIYHSQGQYLMFVDGDDLLLDGAIETLMNTAVRTNSQIAEGKLVIFYDEVPKGINCNKKTKTYSYPDKNSFFLTCYGYSVAKVYKRELWNTLRYPEGYIFEDVITKFILRRKANQVAVVNDVVYGYRYNLTSSSHGSDMLKKLDSIWVLPKVLELCEQEKVPQDDFFYLLALNHIGMLNYVTVKKQPIEIKKACFAEMHRQILTLEKYRTSKMPFMFRLLERAIVTGNMDNWEYIASVISRYNMLKNWREIN